MPLGIILRDVLGLAQSRREAKRMVATRKVMVDGRIETDSGRGVGLMDVLQSLFQLLITTILTFCDFGVVKSKDSSGRYLVSPSCPSITSPSIVDIPKSPILQMTPLDPAAREASIEKKGWIGARMLLQFNSRSFSPLVS